MSASCQQSQCRVIPTRTVVLNDTTQLPHDYCTTPGGTLFSTTPGGKSMLASSKCNPCWLCFGVYVFSKSGKCTHGGLVRVLPFKSVCLKIKSGWRSCKDKCGCTRKLSAVFVG